MNAMHIDKLEFTQLRLLDAISKTRRITLAADLVGVTQSAASHSLGRLRQELQDPIFVRTSQGMEPTPYGETLCAAISEALQLIHAGLEGKKLFDPKTSTHTFTIYMSEAGQIELLPGLLQYLRLHAPGISIHVERLPEKSQNQALESGYVDLAVGHITTMTNGFYQRQLFQEEYVCIADPNNPLFENGMTLEAYIKAKHGLANSSGMAHWLLDQHLLQQNIVRQTHLIVPEFLALPFLIPGSELVVTMPGRVAKKFAKIIPLRVMPLPVKIDPYDILLFWHERVHKDPANQWLRSVLATLFRN